MESLAILKKYNEAVKWRTIRDRIREAVTYYNEALADGQEDPALFLQDDLPTYWQIVRVLNTHQWGGEEHLPSQSGYDVGIFLVGFSSLPIVLSLAEIQPCQEIYFIHSRDTATKCDEITKRFKEMLEEPPADFDPLIDTTASKLLIEKVKHANRQEITDASNPVSTFRVIKDIIDEVRTDPQGREKKIALDLTGGKKTMIGGGFTAGSIYSISPECDMFYVDSLEYDLELGAPKPGSEFLSKLDNPYDVYNVQTVAQAGELFEKHNYEAAAPLWEDACKKLAAGSAKKYGLEKEQDDVQKNLDMANCYRFWDAYDYAEADKHKKHQIGSHCFLCDSNPCSVDTDHDIHSRNSGYSWTYKQSHAHGNNDILDILKRVRNKKTLFAKDATIIHYLVDRYQNGIRRMKSGKLDDAIVRFAQTVEVMCSYLLYQMAETGDLINRDTRASLKGKIDPDTEDWNITPLIRFLFGDDDQYYGSRGAVYIRNSHSQPLNTTEYGHNNVESIIVLIKYRNALIHVNESIRGPEISSNTDALQKLAKNFLRKHSAGYIYENGLDFDGLLKLHEFRWL